MNPVRSLLFVSLTFFSRLAVAVLLFHLFLFRHPGQKDRKLYTHTHVCCKITYTCTCIQNSTGYISRKMPVPMYIVYWTATAAPDRDRHRPCKKYDTVEDSKLLCISTRHMYVFTVRVSVRADTVSGVACPCNWNRPVTNFIFSHHLFCCGSFIKSILIPSCNDNETI